MWVHLISPVTEEEYCIDLAQEGFAIVFKEWR